MTKLEKELSMIFLATAFSRMHIEDVVGDKGESCFDDLEKPTKLLINLSKISSLYKSKIQQISKKAADLFERIENEAKKITPNKKFGKKIRFDEEQHVAVNGLLFGVSLVLEHRNFKNRILRPNYKLANEIMEVYESKDLNKSQMNSRLLAQKYFDEIEKI